MGRCILLYDLIGSLVIKIEHIFEISSACLKKQNTVRKVDRGLFGLGALADLLNAEDDIKEIIGDYQVFYADMTRLTTWLSEAAVFSHYSEQKDKFSSADLRLLQDRAKSCFKDKEPSVRELHTYLREVRPILLRVMSLAANKLNSYQGEFVEGNRAGGDTPVQKNLQQFFVNTAHPQANRVTAVEQSYSGAQASSGPGF